MHSNLTLFWKFLYKIVFQANEIITSSFQYSRIVNSNLRYYVVHIDGNFFRLEKFFTASFPETVEF